MKIAFQSQSPVAVLCNRNPTGARFMFIFYLASARGLLLALPKSLARKLSTVTVSALLLVAAAESLGLLRRPIP